MYVLKQSPRKRFSFSFFFFLFVAKLQRCRSFAGQTGRDTCAACSICLNFAPDPRQIHAEFFSSSAEVQSSNTLLTFKCRLRAHLTLKTLTPIFLFFSTFVLHFFFSLFLLPSLSVFVYSSWNFQFSVLLHSFLAGAQPIKVMYFTFSAILPKYISLSMSLESERPHS